MSELNFTPDSIRDLIELVSEKHLSSFKIEQGDFKLEIQGEQRQATPVPAAVGAVPIPQEIRQGAPQKPAGREVKSPIVGTFYSRPAPEKPAFAPVGSQVKKGDTLYIIESMKLMNEVASEFDGVVAEYYVQDGDPVEYGQPILRLE